MHCNMSLFTEEGNAFFDPEDFYEYAIVSRRILLPWWFDEHAYNYTAIINPTVNSYKRLVMVMKLLYCMGR
ncbi:MAG: hypothetical protein ACLTKL_04060 [Streptococcus salivarius]